VVILKKENAMKSLSTDLKWRKSKECLHRSPASCIIESEPSTIQRQGKRADSKSGIYVRGWNWSPEKVGNSGPLTKCTDVFPRQARENLLTVSDDEHLLNFGKGL
jgi:hypothetical protein